MQYSDTGSVAKIMIVGVGGGGGNAVEAMIRSGIHGVEFVALNTDQQALSKLSAKKLPIGPEYTKGLGAGANPDVGKAAAEESAAAIEKLLDGVDLLFIAAGMGGGTGTGAAPIVASIAKKLGILTIAVVTKPFNFEGVRRMRNADRGIDELKCNVDALVIVQNEKLNKDKNYSIKDAFAKADDILAQGIRGITDIVIQDGRINLDLADVKCVMANSGMAHMGIGEGKGKNKTIDAIRKAVYSPLLETTIQGASSLIVNFRGGDDLTLDEVTTGIELVKQVISPDANVLFGVGFDENMSDEVEVTLIATGFSCSLDAGTAFFGETTPIVTPNPIAQTMQPSVASTIGVNVPTASQQPAQPQNYFSNNTVSQPSVSGTISIEEDASIPPFLRKMKK